MTQQNQPTLLTQAQLTDAEMLEELRSHGISGEKHHELIADFMAKRQLRKAFETIIRWMKEHDFGVTSDDFAVNLMCKTIADELEAEYKEAHDA